MYSLRKQLLSFQPSSLLSNFTKNNFFTTTKFSSIAWYQKSSAFFCTKKEPTVYEQLGGEKAIDAVVDRFYEKVLADDLVNGFFKDINMDRQRKKQKNFIAFATGGPNKYEGRDMRKAHLRFHLEEKHFDEIVKLLVETLKEFKVSDELIGKVAEKLLPLKDEVLNK